MTLSHIPGLWPKVWRTLSPDQRLGVLQQVEDALAQRDQRRPCTVRAIPDAAFENEFERPYLRGYHPPRSYEIYINEGLFNSQLDYSAVYGDENQSVAKADTPYFAVETLFHEDRHAFQEYVAFQRPDLAKNPAQLADFQKNSGDGYLTPEIDGDAYYLMQPVEVDARSVAREQMRDLYLGELGDLDGYIEHSKKIAAEEALNYEIAKSLGEDPQTAARAKAFSYYEHGRTHTVMDSRERAADKAVEAVTQSSSQPNEGNEQQLDHGYGQDYGY